MARSRRQSVSVLTRAGVSIGVLALGVAIFAYLVTTKRQVPRGNGGPRATSVAVFPAQRVPVQRQWQGFGTAEAMDVADVPARVTATVEHLPEDVLVGQPVSRGQLLVQLDDEDFEHEVAIAEQALIELRAQLARLEVERQRLTERLAYEREDLAIAEDELARKRQLFAQQAANEADVDATRSKVIAARRALSLTAEALDQLDPRAQQLEARVRSQESSLAMARLNLSRTQIRSPMEGVLAAVDVEVGESVAPGQRVARVVSLERIEVPMKLPAAARRHIELRDTVRLRPTNDRADDWEGRVVRIAPVDDERTRTVALYVQVRQEGANDRAASARRAGLLVPGMFVGGVVTTGERRPRWVVPRRSVRGGRLMVVEGGRATSRAVDVEFVFEGARPETGMPDDQWAVLGDDAPLTEGEPIVVNISASLREGQPVTPTPLSDVASPAETEQEPRP